MFQNPSYTYATMIAQTIIYIHQIEQVHKKKVLGIVINDELKWNIRNTEQCNEYQKTLIF